MSQDDPRAKGTAMISREEMDRHVDNGRASRWEQPLGDRMPLAVELDGAWWVVLEGTESYQRAPEQLATVLSAHRAALQTAEQQIAAAALAVDTAVTTTGAGEGAQVGEADTPPAP